MIPDHMYLVRSMHSNFSRSRQQSWAGSLLLRKKAPDTIHSTSADQSIVPYLVSLPRQLVKLWGQSQSSVGGRLLGLSGPNHWHAIGTFNTCLWGPTHRSLTNTDGGYNHLKAPPNLRLSNSQHKPLVKWWCEAPITDPWSFDHSTSTEVYIYA
jgi:hypothetical protein